MDRKRLIILTLIFAAAAFYGRQRKIDQNMPKAFPSARYSVRSTFAQNKAIQLKKSNALSVKISAADILNSSIEKLKTSMPTKAQLHKLGEQQVHHMPLSLAEMSDELGTIKQLIHDNPNDAQIIGKSIAFYRGCSAQVQWPTSVRALCLANLHEVAGTSLDSGPVELYRLAKLAVELPEN